MSVDNELKKEHFQELKKNIRYNYQIADFYIDRFQAEGGDIPDNINTPNELSEYLSKRKHSDKGFFETKRTKWLTKSSNIYNCCKYFDLDIYLKLKIKDVKRINLCRDKFCLNCQKMMASERQARFAPQLDELRKDYEVFHLVLSVPNCSGKKLLSTIDKMYKAFPHMLKYFKGQGKIKGVDFLSYGYAGAVRGLEITQNDTTKEFHPHFHCMILFRKGLELVKTIINPYSFDHGILKNKFSPLEVLLQKLWYLLLNGERVTAKAFDELKLGYDVQMTNSEGHYHEVFKYAFKGAFDEDKGVFLYNEQTFWLLYEAFHNRRMIQGYGLLYNFDECEDIIQAELDFQYDYIISVLREIEKPIFRIENLDEVLERLPFWRYISKGNLKRVLEGRRAEIEAKHILLADKLSDDFFDEPEQTTIFDNKEGNKNNP